MMIYKHILLVALLAMATQGGAQILLKGGAGHGSNFALISSHVNTGANLFAGGENDGFGVDQGGTLSLSGNQFFGAANDGFDYAIGTSEPSGIWRAGGADDGFDFFLQSYAPNYCLGDLNYDGYIDTIDLLILIGEFECMVACQADLNDTLGVDTTDLLVLLGVYGTSCEPSS